MHKRNNFLLLIYSAFALVSLFIPSLRAEQSFTLNNSKGSDHVSTEIIFDVDSISLQGESSKNPRIGILFTIEPKWHIYWKNPGESGKPTKIKWDLPEGWSTSELYWPIPIRTIERGDLKTFAYGKKVLVYADLIPPPIVPDKEITLSFKANVSWLECFDRCIPGSSSIEKEILVSSSRAESASKERKYFDETSKLIPRTIDSSEALKKEGVSLATLTEDKSSNILIHSGKNILGAQFFETDETIFLDNPLTLRSSSVETPLLLKIPLLEGTLPPNLNGVLTFKTGENESSSLELINIPLLPASKETKDLYNSNQFVTSKYQYSSYDEGSSEEVSLEAKESDFSILLIALLSAFIGGIILNVMPCVLPILSIKIMGIIAAKEKTTRENLSDSFWFTFGILSSFILLAIVAASLQTSGQALGWGFQFQYPGFVISLILVLFILSLGFFDLYIAELPFVNSLTKLSNKQSLQHDKGKHFFDGVLISALSTPCTAPFLGTALVFAFSQSTIALFLIFIAIGLGLAFPFILVVSQPRLLSLFPRPGAWMNRIKHLMGFGLLATIIWLLKVLEASTPGSSFRTLGVLLALYLFFWFWSWSKEQINPVKKKLAFFIGLSIPLLAVVYLNPLEKHKDTMGSIEWQAYDKSLLTDNYPIFIDFTAEWCITCKYNENFILPKTSIQNLFKSKNIKAIKADWTSGDEEITKLLEYYGGKGVPYYVYLPSKDEKPVILPTILSESIVLDALK